MSEMTLAAFVQRGPAHVRRGLLLGGLTTALAGALGGCFDGSQAQGLPCQTDEDCGPALSCQDQCCGGDCRDAPTTSAVTTEPPPTVTTTNGPTTVGTSTTTTNGTTGEPDPCGVDFETGTAECDFLVQDNCSDMCTWISACGNERLDEGEACDPSSPVEGDAGVACSDDCSTDVIFAWAGTDDAFEELFTTDDEDGALSWGYIPSETALGSGPYPQGMQSGLAAWPESRLATRELITGRSIAQLERLDAVLTIKHRYSFNYEPDPTNEGGSGVVDHGRVFLQSGTATGTSLTPVLPRPDSGRAPAIACVDSQPWTGTLCVDSDTPPLFCEEAEVFGLGRERLGPMGAGFFEGATFDAAELGVVDGEPHRLLFRVRYDCDNHSRTDANDNAWQLLEARVELKAKPGE